MSALLDEVDQELEARRKANEAASQVSKELISLQIAETTRYNL